MIKIILFSSFGDQLSVSCQNGHLTRASSHKEIAAEWSYLGYIRGQDLEKISIYHILEDKSSKEVLSLREGVDFPLGEGALLCQALGYLWGRFFNQDRAISLPKLMAKKVQHKEYESITFYGGSFFPWHEGHRECLRLCPEESIIVVPDSNPWKEHLKRDQSDSLAYWNLFLELAEHLSNTPYGLFSGFWGLPEGNPTVNWFPHFRAKQKNLLMGADTFMGLHLWLEVEKLLKDMKKLYVVPRLVEKKKLDKQASRIQKNFPELSICFLPSHPYEHLSSTLLRENK